MSSLELINLKTIQNFLKQLSAKSHNEDYDYVVVCGDPFMCWVPRYEESGCCCSVMAKQWPY